MQYRPPTIIQFIITIIENIHINNKFLNMYLKVHILRISNLADLKLKYE